MPQMDESDKRDDESTQSRMPARNDLYDVGHRDHIETLCVKDATLVTGRHTSRFYVSILLAPVLALATFAFFSPDLQIVMRELSALLGLSSTSLTSPRGIAALCGAVRTLAAAHPTSITVLILCAYVTLQTLCLPGTIVLNAVLGSILGTWAAVLVCTAAGTLGAVSCYALSSMVGVRLVRAVDGRLMGGRGVASLQTRVRAHRDDLFVYLLFLRLTPLLPNWLINLASPVVAIPLPVFAGATALGILPQTYLSTRFGVLASSAAAQEGRGGVVRTSDTLLLVVVAIAIVFVHRMRGRYGSTTRVTASCAN